MPTYFAEKSLLKTPAKRAAFSDRTAYVMAEMSKLAYFKFEGGHTIDQFLESAKSILGDSGSFMAIKVLAPKFFSHTSPEDARNALEAILDEQGFKLIDTFNANGTQAFMCRDEKTKVVILAFRGTEITEYADIKADINASLEEVSIAGHRVLVHSGYWHAFGHVKDAIEQKLKDYKDDYQIYFTGHSLGGALATVALKYFSSDASGACYTFGAPPVGIKDFENHIKTPLYRIMNHLDIVPNLPNPLIACAMQWFWKSIVFVVMYFRIERILSPKNRDKISKLIRDSSRYRQVGFGCRLLGTEANPKLRYQLGAMDTVRMYIEPLLPRNWTKKKKMKRFLTDHAIDAYSNKLMKWAVSRASKVDTQ